MSKTISRQILDGAKLFANVERQKLHVAKITLYAQVCAFVLLKRYDRFWPLCQLAQKQNLKNPSGEINNKNVASEGVLQW